MKKIIAAGLLSAILTTWAFADSRGSIEIKDDNGNVIGQSRMVEVMPISAKITNQLSQNDQNFIDHAYDTLSDKDVTLLENINYFIDSHLEGKTDRKKKQILDGLVEWLADKVFQLVMKYPADKAMSEADTRLYLMLNTLKLETYAKSW